MSEPATREHLEEIKEMLARALARLENPAPPRVFSSVEEVAKQLGRTSFTAREWCRTGRIHATKRPERRGTPELWSIPSDEVIHHRNEGQLPIPGRT